MHGHDTPAEFFGGPIDGKRRILQGQPYAWTVVQTPGIPLTPLTEEELAQPVTIIHHRYLIRLDHGHPSLTDEGFTRYEYAGASR